ncbi:MAG: ankyrin repeat domain-containing protein [Planctomycetes bacterium]|nr:ankyrin repeat domain-containing protein [Planctomycetota bacterium]
MSLPRALCVAGALAYIAWASAGAAAQERTAAPGSDVFFAAEDGRLDDLRAMLARDPDLVRKRDSIGRTPLHYAAEGNRPEAVEFLAAQEADVEAQDNLGDTPLRAAAVTGALDAAKKLIQLGADPKARRRATRGPSVLDRAAMRGHVEFVELLLKSGAPVHEKDELRMDSALHWACMGLIASKYRNDPEYAGNRKVIRLLAENVKDINLRGASRRTPLHVAAAYATPETVEYLLENYPDVDIDAQDGNGDTALHLAVHEAGVKSTPERRARTAAILLKHGATMEVQNHKRETPLERARAHADVKIVRTLLEALAK